MKNFIKSLVCVSILAAIALLVWHVFVDDECEDCYISLD